MTVGEQPGETGGRFKNAEDHVSIAPFVPAARRTPITGAGGHLPRRRRAATAVTLTLPWLAEHSHLVAFVAKGNGYWSKNGLNEDGLLTDPLPKLAPGVGKLIQSWL
jgi:hypothetical protein